MILYLFIIPVISVLVFIRKKERYRMAPLLLSRNVVRTTMYLSSDYATIDRVPLVNPVSTDRHEMTP